MKKLLSKLFPDKKAIYIGTIIISIILIATSFLPSGIAQAGDILVGLGCSGISAGLLAIFIDLKEKDTMCKQASLLREIVLSQLKKQIECVLSRILWLYEVEDTIDLTNDVKYYFSNDFMQYAKSITKIQYISFDEYDEKIKELGERICYLKIDKDTEALKRTEKISQIIDETGALVKDELKTLQTIGALYVYNNIITYGDLYWISRMLDGMTDKFATYQNGPISLAYQLFGVYKMFCERFNFDNVMIPIAWQDYDAFERWNKTFELFLDYCSLKVKKRMIY